MTGEEAASNYSPAPGPRLPAPEQAPEAPVP